MQKRNLMEEYDGFLFLPSEDEDEETDALDFRFIKYKQDMGAPVDGTEVGPKYHVAFFKRDDEGMLHFDESFEAIFSDPMVYAKGFVGQNVFGTIVKKMEKTDDWFKQYIADLNLSFSMKQ